MANLQPLHALNLDSSQQQTFVRYFKSLPEKPKTTIRFFNRLDYYTVHGDDAVFTSKEVFKSSAAIKHMGAEPYKLSYVVLSKGNMELFIRELLLIKQYRVEVYVNQGSVKTNDWILEYKGSPGNLSQFEDILFSNADVVINSTILAVKWKGDDKNKIVGLVCIDFNGRTFSIAEFSDSEHFSELEALVVQLGPKECLLSISDTPESKTICQIMERSNVLITKRKKSEFSTEELNQDLNRLLVFDEGQIKDANALPEMNLTEACMALNALIKYLELTKDQNNYDKFTFKKLDSLRYVHLDSAAINALHVLPKKEGMTLKSQSILGLLDRCRTPHGKRLLSQWVRQPLRDMNQIEERLDTVESLIQNSEIRRHLHEEHIRKLPDLQLLANKLSKGKTTLQDCYKIYQCLEGVPYLVESLRKCSNKTINGAFVTPISDILQDTEKYIEMIETTLDMDGVDNGEFLVKSSFDEDLQRLRRNMSETEASQKKELGKAARALGLDAGKSIKLDHTSVLGHHFRITLKEEPILRKNKSFRVLDAIKGGVRFTNDKLESLNEDYMQAKNSYEDHQKAIVVEVVKIAAGYAPMLWTLSELLAKLDILVSFSIVASSGNQYVRPRMVQAGTKLSLKAARHPCLELQDGMFYIPNDVDFEEGKRTFSIITGPNMGGKSTYIRSIGVCVLLAHLGSFVPCEEATIPLVDSILARVGAEDCQQRGLSTFMLEMIETASILRTATKNSLVIIDELGRGTSTYEGCGMAWSIAEYLAKEIGAFSLFATHFHEVTRLAETLHQVFNQHVTAAIQNGQLVLMYQLRPGVCDRSFGIHVAKLTDFPENVIKFAEQKQIELESHRIDVENTNEIKNKENAKKEAKDIMKEFLDSCKEIDADSMSEEQIEKELEKLKRNVDLSNPFIKLLIDS